MTFAQSVRASLEAARSIGGGLGLRPYRVFVRHGSWSGTYTGDGTETVAEVELLERGQPPKVRSASGESIAMGLVEKGALRVGPITPGHDSGGTLLDTLRPEIANGSTVHARLLHETGEQTLYRVSDVAVDKALHYTVTLEFVQNLT